MKIAILVFMILSFVTITFSFSFNDFCFELSEEVAKIIQKICGLVAIVLYCIYIL